MGQHKHNPVVKAIASNSAFCTKCKKLLGWPLTRDFVTQKVVSEWCDPCREELTKIAEEADLKHKEELRIKEEQTAAISTAIKELQSEEP